MAFDSLVKKIFDARNKKQDEEISEKGSTKSSVPEFINRKRKEREDQVKNLLGEE